MIAVTAYSPLGSGQHQGELNLMENKVIGEIAKRLNITPAQVMIAWQVNRGVILVRHVKEVLKDQELRLYIIIFVVSILLITFNVRGLYGSWEETIRHAAFQVSSIMTTTGFASTDFDLWPGFSKALLLCLMFVGACAGSTAGGLKMGRLLLILKKPAQKYPQNFIRQQRKRKKPIRIS